MSENLMVRDLIEADHTREPRLIADIDVTVEEILDHFARVLFENPDLPGVAIRDRKNFVGIISRKRLLELAGSFQTRELVEIAGVPQNRASYFVCPRKKCLYRELIIFYDPSQPPRCPDHQTVLEKDG
jgi:hypothetical protein